MSNRSVCPRCRAELPAAVGRGRPRLWCSQVCRRAAYEERRAARSGAVGLRVERVVERVEKPVVRIEYRDRIVEVTAPAPDPAQAAAIVLTSPRACRVVLDGLADAATLGMLHRGEHDATVRAAARLLTGLRAARLLA
jgi:hypothetical protein